MNLLGLLGAPILVWQARVKASTDRLRMFVNESGRCRWVGLLELLGEAPPSPTWVCGQCDACKQAAKYKGDTERDFGQVARVVLKAVQAAAVWSGIEKALNAKSAGGSQPFADSIEALRAALKPKRSVAQLRECARRGSKADASYPLLLEPLPTPASDARRRRHLSMLAWPLSLSRPPLTRVA